MPLVVREVPRFSKKTKLTSRVLTHRPFSKSAFFGLFSKKLKHVQIVNFFSIKIDRPKVPWKYPRFYCNSRALFKSRENSVLPAHSCAAVRPTMATTAAARGGGSGGGGWVYVLKCASGKWYVGSTSRTIKERYDEHKSGRGAEWTKEYPPIEIINQRHVTGEQDIRAVETYETCTAMLVYGVNNVRGGPFVTRSLYNSRDAYMLANTIAHTLHMPSVEDVITRLALLAAPAPAPVERAVCAKCKKEPLLDGTWCPLCKSCIEKKENGKCAVCGKRIQGKYMCKKDYDDWRSTPTIETVTELLSSSRLNV
jgi:DNA-directed RNA polymerase subunit RPC12/RpoP